MFLSDTGVLPTGQSPMKARKEPKVLKSFTMNVYAESLELALRTDEYSTGDYFAL